MPEWRSAADQQHRETETPAAEAGQPARPTDSPLRPLADQLETLLAELAAVQGLRDESTINTLQHGPHLEADTGENCDTGTSRTEAVLARLYPVELTILATSARTIADLGVKARHAAYVLSEYWEAPINHLDWDARTVRLLIEAICNVAGTPLPFEASRKNVDF
jgi:hypothetical protein